MMAERYLGPFKAKLNLLIPNGPGAVPSSMRVRTGFIFSFDGDEPVDIERLERQGAIERWVEPKPGKKGARHG